MAGDAAALPGVDRRHRLDQTDHPGDRHGLVYVAKSWISGLLRAVVGGAVSAEDMPTAARPRAAGGGAP